MHTITRQDIKALLDQAAPVTLVEALPEKYWKHSHLPGAINIPHDRTHLAAGQGCADRGLLRQRALPELFDCRRRTHRARLSQCPRICRRQAGLGRGRLPSGEASRGRLMNAGAGSRKARRPAMLRCENSCIATKLGERYSSTRRFSARNVRLAGAQNGPRSRAAEGSRRLDHGASAHGDRG
jgi:hypothetical protein